MTLEELRAALAAAVEGLRSIHTEAAGQAALTDDQQTRWNEFEAEETRLTEAIKAAEERAAQEARVAERRARWGSTQVAPTRTDPFDLADMRHASAGDMVNRARAAFETPQRGADPAAVQELLRKIDRLAESDDDDEGSQGAELARYALVHGSAAYRSAFRSWFAAGKRGLSPVLTAEEAVAVRASMSLTSANGGYALPTLLDPTLIKTGTATSNPLRQISTVKQGTQDKWNGVTAGAVTTYWKAEGSAFTDGSPTTGGVQVDAAMLTAYVTGSYEIFQDSNLLADLPDLIGEAIDYAEGTAFISGSGSDAPKGIVTAISATAGSTVTATTRGAFTSASYVDTKALWAALPVRFENSSTWVMNKVTWRSISEQMIGTTGIPLIEMTDKNTLLDLPVLRSSDMASATTSGNVLAVLGDFSRFIIYDRLGVNIEFIQNVVDGSGLPTGQRGLVAYKRVGSNVADVNAFRFLKA